VDKGVFDFIVGKRGTPEVWAYLDVVPTALAELHCNTAASTAVVGVRQWVARDTNSVLHHAHKASAGDCEWGY
jgi:hypothetical protein